MIRNNKVKGKSQIIFGDAPTKKMSCYLVSKVYIDKLEPEGMRSLFGWQETKPTPTAENQ